MIQCEAERPDKRYKFCSYQYSIFFFFLRTYSTATSITLVPRYFFFFFENLKCLE